MIYFWQININIKDKFFEIVNSEKYKLANCEFFHSFLKFVFGWSKK